MTVVRWSLLSLVAASLLVCTDAQSTSSTALHGATLFKITCAGCHRIEVGAEHDVGPNLYGIIGQPAASQPGYSYSSALKSSGLYWDRSSLAAWIAATEALVPSTTMTYANVLSGEEVAQLIDYMLETVVSDP